MLKKPAKRVCVIISRHGCDHKIKALTSLPGSNHPSASPQTHRRRIIRHIICHIQDGIAHQATLSQILRDRDRYNNPCSSDVVVESSTSQQDEAEATDSGRGGSAMYLSSSIET